MGMEQGGYHLDEGDQGSYDYGGGGDFNLSMGGGGDSFVIDPGFGLDGGMDWGFDTTSWPTLGEGADGMSDFNLGMGWGESEGLNPVADSFIGIDDFGFYDPASGYSYDPFTGDVLDTGLQQDFQSGNDLYNAYVEYYENAGLDTLTAMELAAQDVQADTFRIETREHEALPDVGQYFPLPYVPNYNPWEFPTYTPTFEDLPPPLPPIVTPTIPLAVTPPPRTPMPTPNPYGAVPKAPGLPPACPTGQYHPFPIGHPDQNKCVPFPPAQTGSRPSPNQQQSRGGASSGGGSTQKPPTQKPPTQQAQTKCPSGQYYSQRFRRCVAIPTCRAGFVFDPVLEACVRAGTQTSALPTPGGGVGQSISDLFKDTPPWLWAALLAALLLASSGGDEKKKVTVQHRRAT